MTDVVATERFRELTLTGSTSERGGAHGEQLRAQIAETLDYYRQLFGLDDATLRQQTQGFADIIKAFNSGYAEEIEAIAAGANLDPVYIYALNSRSEILNDVTVPECTAVMNCSDALLAQNWDWSEALESLVVLLTIERQDGHRIVTLTEPGIIGKIGMNSAGLGVCLNILKTDRALRGVPVHVLLRAILDSRSMQEVQRLLDIASAGKASHVLVGDSCGEYLSVEFAAEHSFRLQPEAGLLLHTNHYQADAALNTLEAFQSTQERFDQAGALLAEDSSAEGLRRVLLDQSQAEMSICRAYSPSTSPGFGNVGTVFTVLMDLRALQMQVRPGANPATPFYRVSV